MKFHAPELPIGKPQPRRRASKLAPLVALIILLTIPLYYPWIISSTKKLQETTSPPYEVLEDSINLTSYVEEAPPSQNAIDPCSVDSTGCRHEKSIDDSTADRPLTPARAKDDQKVQTFVLFIYLFFEDE